MSDVFITIDTEFSAGGYFSGTGGPVTDRAVFCTIDGKSHGLGFLLETFELHGIRVTFFIEAAHTHVLGVEPMKPAVNAILDAGHDVQLHIHPMWLQRDIGPGVQINDSMEKISVEKAKEAFEVGLHAFDAWGVSTPIAFRAGNLQMGRNAYAAMETFGIPVSSSLGLAIHDPADPSLRLFSGVHQIGKVLEVPVLTYRQFGIGRFARPKNLTVTGCGTRETAEVLNKAWRAGMEDIVLLTHPFEFIKRSNRCYDQIHINRVNQVRLMQLCHHIASTDTLNCMTFTAKHPHWSSGGVRHTSSISAPMIASLQRIVENKLNDWLTWY